MVSDEVEELVSVDDGVRLWTASSGEGPAVALCHGGPGMADYLKPVAEMVEDMATVHRWDQRGAGRSDPSGPYSVGRSVADLDALRVHFGHERWALIGHSWGANLAILYAQRHPDRVTGIVYACGTGLEWWPEHSRRHKQGQGKRLGPREGRRLRDVHARARTAEEQREFEWLYVLTEFANSEHASELAAVMHDHDQRFPQNQAANAAINEELKALRLDEQRRACQAVDAPVLVVAAVEDPRPIAATDALVQALPRARRVKLPGCGHFPWLEQPQPFRRVLRSFLAELASRPRRG